MSRKMWMGPRGAERWVPAPASGMEVTPTGWVQQSQYLNGGTDLRSSDATHQEYAPTWNAQSRDALRPIADMKRGMYGKGPIYFIDPMAADKNVLPYQWSVPALAATDGPVLWGDARPATVATPTNDLDYPAMSAQYRAIAGQSRSSVYIPIPPGYTAWVGCHGFSEGFGALEVTPVLSGSAVADPVQIPVLDVTSTTRVNTAFSGDTYRGIEVRFGGSGASVAVISGVMVQILRSTQTPQAGGFISGQGHSGCKFNGAPTSNAISAVAGTDGLVSMSAKLVEYGDWI